MSMWMLSMGIFYFYSLVYMLVHVNEVCVCLTFFWHVYNSGCGFVSLSMIITAGHWPKFDHIITPLVIHSSPLWPDRNSGVPSLAA